MKGITMSKNQKSTSQSQEEPRPSAVAFANLFTEIFDACLAEHKEQKKQAWIKKQKAAGYTLFVMDDGTLFATEIKSSYKI